MFQPAAKACMAITLTLVLVCTTSLAGAEMLYTMEDKTADVSAEAIAVDTLLLRPLGLAATVVGTAVFVVSLPFSLLTKSVDKAAQKLVVDPAKYTFTRPLGQPSD